MPYATSDQLRRMLGTFRLLEMSQEPPEGVTTQVAELLLAASAEMDQALLRAGYSTPIDPTTAEEPHRLGLAALLALHCCVICAFHFAAGVPELPEGIKTAHKATLAWLEGLADGSFTLVGLAKSAERVRRAAGGRIGFIQTDDGLDPNLFRRWGNRPL